MRARQSLDASAGEGRMHQRLFEAFFFGFGGLAPGLGLRLRLGREIELDGREELLLPLVDLALEGRDRGLARVVEAARLLVDARVGEQRVREPREDRGDVAVHVHRAVLHALGRDLAPGVALAGGARAERAVVDRVDAELHVEVEAVRRARRGSGRGAARPAACSSSARRRRGSRSPSSSSSVPKQWCCIAPISKTSSLTSISSLNSSP